MKVAKARWTGTDLSHQRSLPSGETKRFSRVRSDADKDIEWVEIDSVRDADYLDSLNVFEVEYEGFGKLVKGLKGPTEAASSALESISYRDKQDLVQSLGLEVEGNASEEEFNEALKPVVDDLQTKMEKSNG